VEQLKRTIEATEQRNLDKRASDERNHLDEFDRIQRTNDQLKSTLEALLAAPKK
jgi:hypothetical protein